VRKIITYIKPSSLFEGAAFQFKEAKLVSDFARDVSVSKPDASEADTEQIKALKKVS